MKTPDETHGHEIAIDKRVSNLVLFLGAICPDVDIVSAVSVETLRHIAGRSMNQEFASHDKLLSDMMANGWERVLKKMHSQHTASNRQEDAYHRVMEFQVYSGKRLSYTDLASPEAALGRALQRLPEQSRAMLLLWAETDDNTAVLARQTRRTVDKVQLMLLRTKLHLLEHLSKDSPLFQTPACSDGLPTLNANLEHLVIMFLNREMKDHQKFELGEYLSDSPRLVQLLARLQNLDLLLRLIRRPKILEEIVNQVQKEGFGTALLKKLSVNHLTGSFPVSLKSEFGKTVSGSEKRLKIVLTGVAAFVLICMSVAAVIAYIHLREEGATYDVIPRRSGRADEISVPATRSEAKRTMQGPGTVPAYNVESLVTNLVVAHGYEVQIGSLLPGELCYVKNIHQFGIVPEEFRELPFFRSATNLKAINGKVYSFVLNKPATVWIAFDKRLTDRSDLDSWRLLEKRITIDRMRKGKKNRPMHIYERDFPAGPVDIFNRPHKFEMLIVFLRPKRSNAQKNPMR